MKTFEIEYRTVFRLSMEDDRARELLDASKERDLGSVSDIIQGHATNHETVGGGWHLREV